VPSPKLLATANGLVTAGCAPLGTRFRLALRSPRKAQQHTLDRILELNRFCTYLNAAGLRGVYDLERWRQAVPIVRYDDLEPWIAKVADGDRHALTFPEAPRFFERTSGSSGAVKLVPYTQGLLTDFDRAIAPWLFDLYTRRPRLRTLSSYWSISPLAATGERTANGTPIGVEDDGAYLSPPARALTAATRVVPRAVRHVTDLDTWRYVTLRFLVASADLGLVSVWSPSFWSVLCDGLATFGVDLIRDIRDGRLAHVGTVDDRVRKVLSRRLRPDPERAQALEAILTRHGSLVPRAVWPDLTLLSCWTAGASAAGARALAERFPGTELQGKGLLATEGVVSIPLLGHPGGAPALLSHVLEFRPVGTSDPARTLWVDELEGGQDYEVILTTSGGLYRYALGDTVRVVGRIGQTPLIEFVGRVDRVVDLVGEKLHEDFVAHALTGVLAAGGGVPRFAMLAPETEPVARYVLFVEDAGGDPGHGDLGERLDRALAANPHYDHARRLGQLAALEVVTVRDAARRYLDGCASLGQRLGDVKSTTLHRDTAWRARFTS
jgi:hypothetical protein